MRIVRRGLLGVLTVLLVPVADLLGQAPADLMNMLQAPGVPATGFSFVTHLLVPMFLAFVFTVLGLLLFAAALWLIVKIAPFSVRKEIEEDQNVALGIIIGSIILGISIILAAAMIG